MAIIYGVDTTKPYTVKDVRDAIVKCFQKAHFESITITDDVKKSMTEAEIARMKDFSVEMYIKKIFEKTGSDFKNPTKESLIKVCDKLVEFSENFRDIKEIKKHYNQIMKLIEGLR